MNVRSAKPTADEPSHRPTTAAALGKSIACVGFLAALACIAASDGGERTTTAAGVASTGDRAAAHRRQVFEERRARFEARASARVADSVGLAQPKR
ncbi:MAG: hypothetical protein IT518_14480 [Burkholderiales bacterium]|nr:hypothetical protein [Burkholderiales bacterium]